MKQWVLAAMLNVVLSAALAATAQAETCVESQHEGATPGPICLVETFTPSQPLTTGTVFHVRVPAEAEAVNANGNGRLEQAGPPGGMSTWAVTASVIFNRPPFFSPASQTLELLTVARRPKVPGEPVGPNYENAEFLTASFTVPALPTVHDQKFSIRQLGKWCSRHSARRRCASSRRIIITYRYQSAIALDVSLNIWVKSGKRTQSIFRRWTMPSGSQHVQVALSAKVLKHCHPPRQCTLGVNAIYMNREYEYTDFFPARQQEAHIK